MTPAELLDAHLPGWRNDPRAARAQAKRQTPRLRARLLDALDARPEGAIPATPTIPRRQRRAKKKDVTHG
jgi:hypothetical protein